MNVVSLMLSSCIGIWLNPLAASSDVNTLDPASYAIISSTAGSAYFSRFTVRFSILRSAQQWTSLLLGLSTGTMVMYYSVGCVTFFNDTFVLYTLQFS